MNVSTTNPWTRPTDSNHLIMEGTIPSAIETSTGGTVSKAPLEVRWRSRAHHSTTVELKHPDGLMASIPLSQRKSWAEMPALVGLIAAANGLNVCLFVTVVNSTSINWPLPLCAICGTAGRTNQ